MALSIRTCFGYRNFMTVINRYSKRYFHDLGSALVLDMSDVEATKNLRVFSGIQPTGEPHLGNYLGAIKNWVNLQNKYPDVIYSVVDLHAITLPQDPAVLWENILKMFASLVACGLDPDRSIIFKQSDVPYHTELSWILSNHCMVNKIQGMIHWKTGGAMMVKGNIMTGATWGAENAYPSIAPDFTSVLFGDMAHEDMARVDMARVDMAQVGMARVDMARIDMAQVDMAQEKSAAHSSAGVGLLTYPILQAADILLYKTTGVPVGKDQHQHITFTRDLAHSFNVRFGHFFPLPKIIVSETPSIKSLSDPDKKMSKSDPNTKCRINITDTPDEIKHKIQKSVSDSIGKITYNHELRPGVSNLIDIHAGISDKTAEQVSKEHKDLPVGKYKQEVTEVVIEGLRPIREDYVRLLNDKVHLYSLIAKGAEKATDIAVENIKRIKRLVGIS